MQLPKVSIILTTFNAEKTIQRALDSIQNQEGIHDIFEIELIVVDDCSTDGTQAILKSNKIDFLQTEKNSGGPNKGRNMALRLATGDYIAFIDHDDEWLPNKTKSQLELVTKADIVTCGYITKNNSTLQTLNNFERNCDNGYLYFPKNETFLKKLSKNNNSQRTYFGSILISKKLKNEMFEEVYGMVDFDWILRIFENRDSVEICKPLFIRYVHGPNLSLNENYRLCDFSHSIQFIDKYSSQYAVLVKKGKKKMYGSLARFYYLIDNMPNARKYFLKADKSIKNILYYLTSFIGSSFVKKHFNVFG